MELIRRLVGVFLLPAFLAGCWDTDISGVYVAANDQSATLIQIVQSPDGHLQGRFDLVEIKPDGKLQQNTGPVDGAYSSGNVVLTLHVAPVFGLVTISGTADGQSLRLSSTTKEGTSTSVLPRSDEAAFEIFANRLRQASADRLADDARAAATAAGRQRVLRLATAIEELAKSQTAVGAKITQSAGWTEKVAEHYRAITARMKAGLEREQAVIGVGQAMVARSQMAIAIRQLQFTMDTLRLQVDQRTRDFEASVNPLEKESTVAFARCNDSRNTPEMVSACLEFRSGLSLFQARVTTEREAIRYLGDAYQTEKASQDAILMEAQRLVNTF